MFLKRQGATGSTVLERLASFYDPERGICDRIIRGGHTACLDKLSLHGLAALGACTEFRDLFLADDPATEQTLDGFEVSTEST